VSAPEPTARPPLLLLSLPAGTHAGGGDPRLLVDLAVRAEAAGIDGVVIADHVLIGDRTDRYQWGPFPFPPEAPWLEPLTVLAAIATATERLLLTTGILIVPLRPAPFLAKQVATLDHLSGGRVVLGVGTGWQDEEFTAQGLDPADRGQLLTDFVAACRMLWRYAPASFASPSVTFERVWSEPRPTAPGGPPILFSGTLTARNRRRIVELGDGWIPIMGTTVEGLADGVADLRVAFASADRDPAALRVRMPLPLRRGPDGDRDVVASMEALGDVLAAGATEVSVASSPFVAADDPGAGAWLDELVSAWRAALPSSD
jgi:probable F420-dependent oxidoreductase